MSVWYRPKLDELFFAAFVFYDFKDEYGNYWADSTAGLAVYIGEFD